MATALTETAAQRHRIYRGLMSRNRGVGMLRVLVPGVGVAVFVLLAGQVMIANLAENFSIGRITLQNDRMVVETPSYSGVASDGARYTIKALSAEAGLNAMDAVALNGATLVIDGTGGVQTTAEAARAELQTAAQTVKVPGKTTLSTSSGMTGSLVGMDLDFTRQVLTTTGVVTFTFAGGERLDAQSMRYDGNTSSWSFSGVTLTLPATPKAMEK